MGSKTQIFTDMPNEAYHRGEWQKEYISSTSLKNYIVSPKYYKYTHENGKDISLEASMRGSVYHSMLASLANTGCIDEFNNEYFVFDAPINPRTNEAYGISTKAYGDALANAMAANPGKEVTSQAEVALAQRMIDALLNDCEKTSECVSKLLEWGKAEVSYFVEYEGMKFKFRTDLRTENKIVDWKTIAADDLHENTIAKQIHKMGYGFSAAFYQFFDHLITGKWVDFYWVFQQKAPPYDAVIVSAEGWGYTELADGSLFKGVGARQFENILAKHFECTRDNKYIGAESFIYSADGYPIMTAAAPAYANKFLLY